MKYLLFCLLLGLVSCSSVPANIQPVSNFDLDKYLGEWYEIARLDHSFEKGLSQVKAVYSLQDNGTVKVINKGYLAKEGQWQEAEGKAKFAGDSSIGHLKVSFFGPFYGPYVIYELGEQYQYAFVTSGTDYLWLLARTPSVSEDVMGRFVKSAEELGHTEQDLIFVEHQ